MDHRLNEHELGQILGDGEGQGSLVCCNPWGCKGRHNLAMQQQQHISNLEEILTNYLSPLRY